MPFKKSRQSAWLYRDITEYRFDGSLALHSSFVTSPQDRNLIDEYLAPALDLSVAAITEPQSLEALEECLEALNATILQCIGLLGYPKFVEGGAVCQLQLNRISSL
ncbi:MAG TPA: hypothetical protein V6D14_10045 [Coleofasciculaceae cyanobacterium]